MIMCFKKFRKSVIALLGILFVLLAMPIYSNAEETKTAKVTFDANGGCFDTDNTLEYKEETYNIGQNVILSNYKCVREGYQFLGWKDKKSTEENYFTNNFEITGDIDLVAGWAKICKLTFYANGGYFDVQSTITGDVYTDTEIKEELEGAIVHREGIEDVSDYYRGKSFQINTPIRDGYVFAGWKINDTDEIVYSYKIKDSTTFTAQWKKKCFITWHANGGKFDYGATSTKAVVSLYYNGDLITLTKSELSYSHHILKGWKIKDDQTNTIYEVGSTYTVTGNTEFIAEWEKELHVKYMYDENNMKDAAYVLNGTTISIGDSLSKYQYSDKDATTGDTRAVSPVYNPPVYNDKKLIGWKINGDSSEKIYKEGDSFNVTDDVTFIAVYETVTDNTNDKTKETSNNTKTDKSSNATITVKNTSLKTIKPKKKGFKITLKKITSVDGYEIKYSTKKTLKGAKTKKIKKGQTSVSINKLKSKKRYYVSVRSYKTVDGKTYYSGWSKVKSVKTK